MIKKTNNRSEKIDAIRLCDSSFANGICKREDFEEIFDKIDRYADFFISYDDGNISGYAAMYNNDFMSKTAYITMIGVRDIYQRRKIGSSLLISCMKSARDQGMNAIRLEVMKINTKALQFYKKAGFILERDCSDSSVYMLLYL